METAGSAPSPDFASLFWPVFLSPATLALGPLLGSSAPTLIEATAVVVVVVFEPGSVSIEPGSFGLGRPGLGEDEEEPKEAVQATISRSRLMWATASSSV